MAMMGGMTVIGLLPAAKALVGSSISQMKFPFMAMTNLQENSEHHLGERKEWVVNSCSPLPRTSLTHTTPNYYCHLNTLTAQVQQRIRLARPHNAILTTIIATANYRKHEYNDKRLIINSKLCQYISCMPDSQYSNVRVQ